MRSLVVVLQTVSTLEREGKVFIAWPWFKNQHHSDENHFDANNRQGDENLSS